jgi:twitching motility protein PilI
VVDLAGFIAFDTGVERAEPPVLDPTVVTLNIALEVNAALQVDGLLGLRGADAFASSSPPATGAPGYFGNQFQDTAGEQWQEIDLRILSQTPQFLSVSA